MDSSDLGWSGKIHLYHQSGTDLPPDVSGRLNAYIKVITVIEQMLMPKGIEDREQ
jgi:hypothetical protein